MDARLTSASSRSLRGPGFSTHPTPSRSPPTVFLFSYEDLVALDGGDEGMDIITHILTLAPRLLNASGYGHQPPPPSLCNRQALAVTVQVPLVGQTTWKCRSWPCLIELTHFLFM